MSLYEEWKRNKTKFENERKLNILNDILENYNLKVVKWEWNTLADLIHGLPIKNDNLIVDLASRYEELFYD